MSIAPRLCYTIWFTQRTGSTLLCKALEGTGVAGTPGEHLHADDPAGLLARHGVKTSARLQAAVWQAGGGESGVCGIKQGFYEPNFSRLLAVLRQFPGGDRLDAADRPGIWENAFPNHRHLFMTRRNKVRLAVSWWKAIQTQEWHREHGAKPSDADVADHYLFPAIDHLLNECVMREAGIQEFFAEAGIIPLTITYEDFIRDYAGTVNRVLRYLSLPEDGTALRPPHHARLADEVSEEWAQRFRREKQAGWQNLGW